jgi:hypothetical protein
VLGVFQPYTGANASFGAEASGDCYAAQKAINDGGGVLGRKVACQAFDSGTDPADELAPANRMIASTSNLAMIFGPAIDLPVEQILDNAKLVHFTDDGDPRLDHQASPYFFRTTPSDRAGGAVYALWTFSHGYHHAAAVFTNDAGAQTSVTGLRREYRRLGGKFAIDLTLAPGQTSYRTEVAQVLAAKPDAIVTEMDPQTGAAFFSEMLQLNNGKLPPIIQTSRALDPAWLQPVLHAIGNSNFQRYFTIVGYVVPNAGPGYVAWTKALLGAPQHIDNRQGYLAGPYDEWEYDGYVLGALAITAAKSTDPTKWEPLVMKIANGTPGAVIVHTYAEGRHALASGHQIRYVGATGPLSFNRWHNNSAAWAGYRYTGNGTSISDLVPNAGTLSTSQVAQAVG